MDRTLYFVTGRDAYNMTVWGCHLYAQSPAEAREIAAGFVARDRKSAEGAGLAPLPTVDRYVTRKSTSYANAMN